MHAGYPMLEQMVALMQTYPQVYVDVAEIDWVRPRASFDDHLRGLVDAGFEKRILFGSDQMAWPDAIGVAIQTIETAKYLTEQQKRDILCNNAARFFRWPEEICRE
jgi:predicted TIM-barrel fold metal-dependent hydrolase